MFRCFILHLKVHIINSYRKDRDNMKFYWEINPEDLSECAYNLMIMYNKYAEKGKKLQQSINSKNFKKNIEQLLEIEAILSEIQFYLEEINLESADTNNVISQIETEYLVDYYYKIGNADKEGNFFASLLRNKVCKQKQLRFGIFLERVII